jgi:arabinofuranosyltransferase
MKSNTNTQSTGIRTVLLNAKWQTIFLLAFALFTSILLIVIGFSKAQPGYPLDDAWIHQTYARNFAESGRWEYNRGEASAGSTSPLWTMLICAGYFLGITNPFIWTLILSVLFFILLVLIVRRLQAKLTPHIPVIPLAAGMLIALDWHLLWGTVSGMETILFCFVITLIFLLIKSEQPIWWLVGLIAGLSVWIRPDGITILGPILLLMAISAIKMRLKLSHFIFFIFSLLVPLVLYGLFNKQLSGEYFPNTFFAKQAEYAILLKEPFLIRTGNVFSVVISGAGLFLLPGFIWGVINAIKTIDFWKISSYCWVIGYGLLYVMRLPAIYQHGRYLFAMIPIFTILGLTGLIELINRISSEKWKKQNLKRIFSFAIFSTLLIFLVLGIKAFTEDLQVGNRLFVQPSVWIKENTNKSAVIAAHDIGAIGYFSDRKIIDLAGLIQPEIIPFIRNEGQIAKYIAEKNADYLVTFLGWYPELDHIGVSAQAFIEGNETVVVQKLH